MYAMPLTLIGLILVVIGMKFQIRRLEHRLDRLSGVTK